MTDIEDNSPKENIVNPNIMNNPESIVNPNKTDTSLQFQLGDIIQINAPSNSTINDMIFVINYIDDTKIKLINVVNLSSVTLNILPSGKLSDESIQSISILSRPEYAGYAKQNNLLPKTWIDIYFGGDLPVTITGQITNLEDDMIEIKTYPDQETIYIDFGYRGIPENIPIERINIRTAPTGVSLTPESSIKTSILPTIGQTEEQISVIQGVEIPEQKPEIQAEKIRTVLKEILLDADQFEFGEDLEVIKQTVEVPEEQKRYSLDKQCNDLLNELLSTIPNDERTRSVLQNINTMITRFKQLREEYSIIDKNGNFIMKERLDDG